MGSTLGGVLRMGVRIEFRRRLLLCLTFACLVPVVVSAQPAAIAPTETRGDALDASVFRVADFDHRVPAGLSLAAANALWRRGIEAETREAFIEAIEAYTMLAAEAPSVAYPYWKVARNLWRRGESFPVDAKVQRMQVFAEAEAWADRGLTVDPACAECMLWKFGAMGRMATTRGLLASLRAAPEMRDLLEAAIALQPDFADSPYNTALGNLYYASAVFYRMVPEWRWLDWTLGVRGDMQRALEMIRAAKAISPSRIDYTVELGAILSCYGARRDAEWANAEARSVLASAAGLPIRMDQDPLDLEHASTLLAEPEKGCGYSRDGWVDVERGNSERAAR
jgi:tetratricopeptide (TPR) repeat protein